MKGFFSKFYSLSLAILILFATLIAVFSGIAKAAPVNLIANPSAETSDTNNSGIPQSWLEGNWGTNDVTFSYLNTGHTGSHSLKVQINSYTSGDAKWYFAPIAVAPDTQYDFSDYYESSVGTDLVAQFDDGNGNYTYSQLTSTQPPSMSWSNAAVNFVTPSNAKYVTIFHLINSVGWLQTDDFSLNTVTTPSVAITSPASNATLAGTVQVSANASSIAGIANVQFMLDGTALDAPVSSAPYQISLDTTKLVNGDHRISAVATGKDGQVGTSTPVMINVSNGSLTATNIVPNPSVETVNSATKLPASWSKGSWGSNSTTFNYLSSGAHSGTHSLKVQIGSYTSGASYWYFTPQPVVANHLYDFTDYYKSNVISEIDAGITMKDGSIKYQYLGSTYPSKNSWTKFETQFTMPADAVSVTIYHLIYKVGWLQTDDFSLAPYTLVGFNRPIISLTFDDGYKSFFDNGLPLLQKYNFQSTDYIISGAVGNDPSYMTIANLKQLLATGNEIGSHTVTHPDLTTLSATKLNAELKNSQASLQKWLGVPVTDFAAPYGAYNQQVISSAQQYYRSFRTVDSGFNAKSNFDINHLMVQNMVSTTPLSQVEAWVDQAIATNTWLILVYHQVDPTLDPTAEPYNTYPADLDNQLGYIKHSGVSVETVNQALNEIIPQVGN